jgi:hypothetical protein
MTVFTHALCHKQSKTEPICLSRTGWFHHFDLEARHQSMFLPFHHLHASEQARRMSSSSISESQFSDAQ